MKHVFLWVLSCTVLFGGCASMGSGVYSSAFNNDMAGVRARVAQGYDVNAFGDFGMTPLYTAVTNKNAEMVQFLLEHGADPNKTTGAMVMGISPLGGAIWKGYTEIVQILLQKGADVNLASPVNQFTPILYCGAYGNAEIAKMLVDAGADVTARDNKGKTAVDYAVEYKKYEVLAVLRKAGVPVSYTGEKKTDIIMAIVAEDKPKVLSLLNEGANPNAKTKSGKQLLAYAVEYKWADVVEELIRKGADVKAKDETGWTPIMTAAFNNETDIVEAFHNAGVGVPYSGDKKNDLLIAVLFSDMKKAEELIIQGADVKGRYRYNSPLLNYAAFKKDRPMLELLLKNGADPNVPNDEGWAPLTIALSRGGADLGRFMLERGASVNMENGWPPLQLAIATGDVALVRQMIELGATVGPNEVMLSEGRMKGHEEVNFPEITALIKPETLRRQMLRAQAAVETAQSPADYQKAIAEYVLARDLSPDQPEIYYNLGMVQEKAGAYADAIQSFQKYLMLAPQAPDAQEVRDMIYKIEYKRDQGKR
ncbi:MAG: tetratricopeptide repeat protein [Elusimicrobia bacterium]|nr:tetratricopeptide repeat protein [Elusimicrobiota bacterium]